jgi:hypothetical protein
VRLLPPVRCEDSFKSDPQCQCAQMGGPARSRTSDRSIFARTGEASAEECAYTSLNYQSPRSEGERPSGGRKGDLAAPFADPT